MIKHSCCSIGSEARLLLREVDHRVRNEIASAINLVAVAAVRAESCDVKSALSQVVELLHDHADVHSALRIPEHDQLVDAAENLRKLVMAISRSRLERMKINLVFAANTLPMEADRCWRLRLAVNELITNAARHAHFGGRLGEIRIEVTRAGSFVECKVSDNGVSTPQVRPVRGLKIVGELAHSLGGRIGHSAGSSGASFALVFPFTERELQANRTVAERRRRQARRLKVRSQAITASRETMEESVCRETIIAETVHGLGKRSHDLQGQAAR